MAADKMLRIAARGIDGLAKAVRSDNSGNLLTKIVGSITREQTVVANYTAQQMADGRAGTGYQYQDVFLKGNKTGLLIRSYLKAADGTNIDSEICLFIGIQKYTVKQITNVDNQLDNAFPWTTMPYLQFGYYLIDENTEGWEYINSGGISDCRVAVRYKGAKIPASGGIDIYALSV